MEPSTVSLVVFIVGAVLGTITALAWLGIRMWNRAVELAHIERMKAIEAGLPIDEIEREKAADASEERFRQRVFVLSSIVGGLVPFSAVLFATVTVLNADGEAGALAWFIVWSSAAVIGLGGVISGTWLFHATGLRFAPGSMRAVSGRDQGPYSELRSRVG